MATNGSSDGSGGGGDGVPSRIEQQRKLTCE